LNYPAFSFVRIQEWVVSGITNVDAVLLYSLRNEFEGYSEYVTITSVNYYQSNETIWLNLLANPSIEVPWFLEQSYLENGLSTYVAGILRYPNNSFVTANAVKVNSTLITVDIKYYSWHCKPPAPFYGTYCLDTYWYSEGTITISTEDLISSSSGTLHQGTFQVLSTPLTVQGSSFQTGINLIVNASSTLSVYDSSVTVGETFQVIGSTLEIGANGANITAQQVVLTNHSALVIVLSPVDEAILRTSGALTIQPIYFSSLTGQFESITVQTSNGTFDTGCITSSADHGIIIIQVLFAPCQDNNLGVQNYNTLAVIIALPIVGVSFVIAAIVIYTRQQAMVAKMRKLRSHSKNTSIGESF